MRRYAMCRRCSLLVDTKTYNALTDIFKYMRSLTVYFTKIYVKRFDCWFKLARNMFHMLYRILFQREMRHYTRVSFNKEEHTSVCIC